VPHIKVTERQKVCVNQLLHTQKSNKSVTPLANQVLEAFVQPCGMIMREYFVTLLGRNVKGR